MGFYRKAGRAKLPGRAGGKAVLEAYLAHYQRTVPVASATGVHAAITLPTSGTTTVTTGFTQPAVPRNVTVKGNQAGIVGNVVVNGKRGGKVITETIALNGVAEVVGNLAFDAITSVVVPVRNGAGDTVSIGKGSKLGLEHLLDHNTVQAAYLNKVKEGVAPTVATHASNLESNTVLLNSALDGNRVDLYYWV